MAEKRGKWTREECRVVGAKSKVEWAYETARARGLDRKTMLIVAELRSMELFSLFVSFLGKEKGQKPERGRWKPMNERKKKKINI